MRFIATPILFLLVMSQSFQQWVVIGAFKLKQTWISNNTCENRFRPRMHCNGNCVLMKKLQQQEKEEQNAPPCLKLELNQVLVSSTTFFATVPAASCRLQVFCYPDIHPARPVDRSQAIFHPPQAAWSPLL